MRTDRIVASVLLVVAATACRRRADHEDREDREDEDEDDQRANYWRARIAIVGSGRVTSLVDGLDCVSDGRTQHGACGPRLFVFDERRPPLLRAIAPAGWRFDHWEAQTRAADGTLTRRTGRMPDGHLYLDGFGYADTGATQTVFALFEPAGDLGEDDAR